MSESILLDLQSQIASITLSRPARFNSFTLETRQVLQAALDNAEGARPAVRALLLTRAGRGLIAGQNLSDRKHLDLERDLHNEACITKPATQRTAGKGFRLSCPGGHQYSWKTE